MLVQETYHEDDIIVEQGEIVRFPRFHSAASHRSVLPNAVGVPPRTAIRHARIRVALPKLQSIAPALRCDSGSLSLRLALIIWCLLPSPMQADSLYVVKSGTCAAFLADEASAKKKKKKGKAVDYGREVCILPAGLRCGAHCRTRRCHPTHHCLTQRYYALPLVHMRRLL